MNETKSVSRIVGMIDLGSSAANPLCEIRSLITVQKRHTANTEETLLVAEDKNLQRSFSQETEVVFYEAQLPQLMRQLEREMHVFQRLYARAQSLEQAGHN